MRVHKQNKKFGYNRGLQIDLGFVNLQYLIYLITETGEKMLKMDKKLLEDAIHETYARITVVGIGVYSRTKEDQILKNQLRIMQFLRDMPDDSEEKSCMTPEDCECCDNDCGCYTEPSSVEVTVDSVIPEAPDLDSINPDLTMEDVYDNLSLSYMCNEDISFDVFNFVLDKLGFRDVSVSKYSKFPPIITNIPRPKVSPPKTEKEKLQLPPTEEIYARHKRLEGIRRSELKNKHSRHCSVCNIIAVHDSSSSGICPDCAAYQRLKDAAEKVKIVKREQGK